MSINCVQSALFLEKGSAGDVFPAILQVFPDNIDRPDVMVGQSFHQIDMVLEGLFHIEGGSDMVYIIHIQMDIQFPIRPVDEFIVSQIAQFQMETPIQRDVFFQIDGFSLQDGLHIGGKPAQRFQPGIVQNSIVGFDAVDFQQFTQVQRIEDGLFSGDPEQTLAAWPDFDNPIHLQPFEGFPDRHHAYMQFLGEMLGTQGFPIGELTAADRIAQIAIHLLCQTAGLDHGLGTVIHHMCFPPILGMEPDLHR